MIGDFGVIDQTPGTLRILTTGNVIRVSTTQRPADGGSDRIYGNDGEDVVIGGAHGDAVDGGAGKDLVFGDNVVLDRTIGDGALNAGSGRCPARRSTAPRPPRRATCR